MHSQHFRTPPAQNSKGCQFFASAGTKTIIASIRLEPRLGCQFIVYRCAGAIQCNNVRMFTISTHVHATHFGRYRFVLLGWSALQVYIKKNTHTQNKKREREREKCPVKKPTTVGA